METVQPAEIRDHLGRITSSALFAESERLRRFLEFTVESKLAGLEDRIKEYILGREVFDRPSDYDPRTDPIVRVEARRLRTKLAEYYEGPGRRDPLRFEYPKGSYAPKIRKAERSETVAAPRSSRSLRWALAGTLGLAAFLVSALIWQSGAVRHSAKIVAVLPSQWVSIDQTDLDPNAIDLSEAIASAMANSRAAPVIAWPIIENEHQSDGSLKRLAARTGANTFVIVVVRPTKTEKVVSVFVVDAASGQKLRAEQYIVPRLSLSTDAILAQRIVKDLRRPGVLL